jgi:hypothetical protein
MNYARDRPTEVAPTTYHAGHSGTPNEPLANRRAPVRLTPAQIHLRTYGRNPARTCSNSQYFCQAVEHCDGDDICREHGEILGRSSARHPVRCEACLAESDR